MPDGPGQDVSPDGAYLQYNEVSIIHPSSSPLDVVTSSEHIHLVYYLRHFPNSFAILDDGRHALIEWTNRHKFILRT